MWHSCRNWECLGAPVEIQPGWYNCCSREWFGHACKLKSSGRVAHHENVRACSFLYTNARNARVQVRRTKSNMNRGKGECLEWKGSALLDVHPDRWRRANLSGRGVRRASNFDFVRWVGRAEMDNALSLCECSVRVDAMWAWRILSIYLNIQTEWWICLHWKRNHVLWKFKWLSFGSKMFRACLATDPERSLRGLKHASKLRGDPNSIIASRLLNTR